MSYLINIVVLYFLSVFTISALPNFNFLGALPLIPLFFVIAMAYFRKGFEPILLAALAGIYFDLHSSYPFGFYLLLFLVSASLVRYMFQEGMNNLSLWYYSIFCGISILAYLIFQIVYLYLQKVAIGTNIILPIVLALAVNAVCVILVYVFSDWYFEKISALEDKLKRR